MNDARNIALTLEASAAADTLCDRFRLPQKLDAVRLGIAYAIRQHVDLDRTNWGRPGGTNYNIASVDTPDATFRALVPIFYDETEVVRNPYRAIETLMNKGLVLLQRAAETGEVLTFRDLVLPESDRATTSPASE